MASAGAVIDCDTLQRSLQQLEYDLHAAMSLRPGRVSTRYSELSYQEIRNKFLFLKSLFSAELKSRPRDRCGHQLEEIGRRLSELEAAFNCWEESDGPTTDDQFCCNHFVPENDVSTCCCSSSTEPCVNDDVSDLDGCDEAFAAAAHRHESFEKAPASAADSGRRESRVWGFLGGMVFGMTLMGCVEIFMLPFYFNFDDVEHNTCLVPT